MLDLIGPDVQAFTRAPHTSHGGVLARQQHSYATTAYAVHETRLELCKTCRQRRRSIQVRMHACGYEAAAPNLIHEPDIVCMFHPGLAADQPQSIEKATAKSSDQRAGRRSVARGRKRKHMLHGGTSQRGCKSRPGSDQDSRQVTVRPVERPQPPLAPNPSEPTEPCSAGGQVRCREEDMPSLKEAWVGCFPQLASLTCPLLVTAFSVAGASMHL